MKKKEALVVLNSKIISKEIDAEDMYTKDEIKKQIRFISDRDEGFENAIFELGCSVLAKHYLKKSNS